MPCFILSSLFSSTFVSYFPRCFLCIILSFFLIVLLSSSLAFIHPLFTSIIAERSDDSLARRLANEISILKAKIIIRLSHRAVDLLDLPPPLASLILISLFLLLRLYLTISHFSLLPSLILLFSISFFLLHRLILHPFSFSLSCNSPICPSPCSCCPSFPLRHLRLDAAFQSPLPLNSYLLILLSKITIPFSTLYC